MHSIIQIQKFVPASPRHKLQQSIDIIGANTLFFRVMQALRHQSVKNTLGTN